MQSHLQGNLSLPSGPNFHSSGSSPGPSRQSQRIPSIRSAKTASSASQHAPPPPAEPRGSLSREHTRPSTRASSAKSTKWWHVRLFRGMANDFRRRAPYYGSDLVDAWDYRIVPATVYMFFAKYGPLLSLLISVLYSMFLRSASKRQGSLTYPAASCLPWLSRWICLRRPIKASG
jgi:hypothetical protein